MRPAIAQIHLANLAHNYHLLCNLAGSAQLMAVVKANAYGHGLEHVASCLYTEGCRLFAVTDAAEGKLLRQWVGDDAQVMLLSGLFDRGDAAWAEQNRLTPVVTEPNHLAWLKAVGFSASVWLKVDTGMQRLGCLDAPTMVQACEAAEIDLTGVLSHLACADEPEHPLNQQQLQRFQTIHQTVPKHLKASLLNSAGLIAMPEQRYDVVRPGLALYGMEPIAAQKIGLKPVMTLAAQVMQVRSVKTGTSISYGASFVASQDMQVALVALGYGDGLPRELSNCGCALFQGARLPMVGRVCMDYCLLDCSDSPLQAGDWVEFWGEGLLATEVADLLNTIPYTLTTGLQSRLHRQAIQA